jgi:signal transduction histidine kinase
MLARTALEESRAKLQESEKSLRELSLHLLRTQDEERRLIGREMHDSLGQFLSVLKMKLDGMSARAAGNPNSVKQQLDECAALVDECVREVRTVSYLLYPPMLEEMGLKSAIPWYLDGFSKRSGIKVKSEIPDDFERLPRETELVLFRVLQEGLTNVHKHSGSLEARIRLRHSQTSIILDVIDRGKGLPLRLLEESGRDWMGSLGVGLRGMSERLRQLGGTLDVSSNKDGTTVRAVVPIGVSPDTNTGS